MELIKEINLNINQPNQFELINVMQGSINSLKVIAHLYDGNQPYQIPDTVSEYQLLGILPSGKYLIDDKVTKYDTSSVSFLINKNIMAKAGYVQFTISLVEAGDKAIVETFPTKIMVTAIPGQEYEQTDEIPIITESLQEVKRNTEIAVQSAQAAKTSETNAKISEDNAINSAAAAKTSETNAKASETNSANSASTASEKAMEADLSAIMAKSYTVGDTGTRPDEMTDNAKYYQEKAKEFANHACDSSEAASDYAKQSQSYAVGGTGNRAEEKIDNAKYYYEQSKAIAESFSGALRPMGTIKFANLPSLSTAIAGDMYNISDQFITDENFKENSGLTIPAGSNVYKTVDGKWDILAGSPVTGIKGNAETTYRQGNVNLTAENIGLGGIKEEINELKKSVSDGKSAVASAITTMGKSTSSDATFQTMADNIIGITPTLSQNGQTVSATINGNNKKDLTVSTGELNTPTMSWNGATLTAKSTVKTAGYLPSSTAKSNTATLATKAATTVTPGKTEQTTVLSGSRVYFSGDLKVASLGGNAATSHVLNGITFSSNTAGREQIGSMPNLGVQPSLYPPVSDSVTASYGYYSSDRKIVSPILFVESYGSNTWHACAGNGNVSYYNGNALGTKGCSTYKQIRGSETGLAIMAWNNAVKATYKNTNYVLFIFNITKYNGDNNIGYAKFLLTNNTSFGYCNQVGIVEQVQITAADNSKLATAGNTLYSQCVKIPIPHNTTADDVLYPAVIAYGGFCVDVFAVLVV